MSLVRLAHKIITTTAPPRIRIAVDATTGNGNDTLFLAQLVGESGHVYGFDMQSSAINATSELLSQYHNLSRYTLLHAGHENLSILLQQRGISQCAIIMFNLGYLPRGDKTITTHTETTLNAIRQGLTLLHSGGLISIVAYPGHRGGKEETESVRDLVQSLSKQHFTTQTHSSNNATAASPELHIIRKNNILD